VASGCYCLYDMQMHNNFVSCNACFVKGFCFASVGWVYLAPTHKYHIISIKYR
jgi:hypothetical protein